MAGHLRHELAREGLVVRPKQITTLSRFIEPWCADAGPVSPAALYLLVERALRRERPREFAALMGLPGFAVSLARVIDELSAAGCAAAQVPGAVGAVFREVERQIERRGLALRSRRLAKAAEEIDRRGLGGIHTVLFEGFFALTGPERQVMRAAARHARVRMGEPLEEARRRIAPGPEVVRAASPDREADEIARRILEEADRGTEFRRCGVIVRNPETMVPPLRAAFGRFGIPARFYFDSRLDEHPAIRHLGGLIEAGLSRWDFETTLRALRQSGTSEALDRLDFEVRSRMPGRGLETLEALGGDEAGTGRLRALDAWAALSLPAANWAAALKTLAAMVPPPAAERISPEEAAAWRSTAAALQAYSAALDETAAILAEDGALPLDRFWKAAAAAIRLTPLRTADRRRNVVPVLSVYEARQWELEAVFVCGLVEGQFPKYHSQDPFLSDAGRRELQRAGVPVRTSTELEKEERDLFDYARTRAGRRLVLTWAETDERGNQTVPSAFLEGEPGEPGIWVRPLPARQPSGGEVRIAAPELLPVLQARHARLSPSGLESFLRCPFQFFAAKTLRLKQRPPLPRERLDFLLRGTIAHETLARVSGPGDLERTFDRIFRRAMESNHIPDGYAAEACRRELLDDLRAFLEADGLPPAAERRTEEEFELALSQEVTVRGRIDRVDRLADGTAAVVDYKYSPPQSVLGRARDEEALQGPLYVLAARQKLGWPVRSMSFAALRGGGRIVDVPVTEEWIESGRAKALAAAARIRAGEIAPAPSDTANCSWCEFRDVCRYDRLGREAGPEDEA
jgi:RecB family exonuclease